MNNHSIESQLSEAREFYEGHAHNHHSKQSPTDGRTVFRHYRASLLLKLLSSTLTTIPIRSVLDIGSEEGFLSVQLSRQGLDVTALDLSRGRLLDMRKRERADKIIAIQGDGSRLPLADESYDMVLVTDIIEHIPDFDLAVLESLRVTKRCWIFSTNMHGLHRQIACAMGKKDLVDKIDRGIGHLHVFTYDNLKNRLMLHLGGLHVEEELVLFTVPPIVTLLTFNGLLRGDFVPHWLNLFNSLMPKFSKNWFANWIVLVAFKE